MGTEQDGKEAFSNGSRGENEVLDPHTSKDSQYIITPSTATSLRGSQVAVPLQAVYAVTPHPDHVGSLDIKNIQTFTQNVAIPTSAESSFTHHARGIQNMDEEDMDVVHTLADLHKAETYPPTSQSSRLFVISQHQDGEIEIYPNENVTLEKGEEKLLKKIAKTAAVRPLKSDKDAAYASLDTEILQYLVRYEGEEATKKITMRDLRHVIPLLIMRCYAISDEPYQRKVRGMWAEKPNDWPADIPYCDPNNKKDSGKPKKSTLLQMFMYLKGVYAQNHKNVIEKYKQRKIVHSPHVVTSSPFEAMETVTTTTAAMPASAPSTSLGHSGPLHREPAPASTFATALTLRDHDGPSPPPTVTHAPQPVLNVQMTSFSELKQDWDPEAESMDRINNKMKRLEQYFSRNQNQGNMLYVIRDVLCKMYQVRSQDHLFFLEIAHEFEASLDVIHVTRAMPEKSMKKWQEFYEKNQEVPDVAASEQVLDITEDSVACEPLGLGREEEVITDHNIVVSILNDTITKEELEKPETPAHYIQTFSEALEQSDPVSSLSPNLQDISLNDNPENDVSTLQEDVHAKYNMINLSESDRHSTRTESVTSELGALLTTSLQVTEDVNYNVQPYNKVYSVGSPSPAGCINFPDAHDETLFPLSAGIQEEKFGNNILIDDVVNQPLAPSTRFVSTSEILHNSADIIDQEQNNVLNIDITRLKMRERDEQEKTEKVKSMVQAFYQLQKSLTEKNLAHAVPSTPPAKLTTAYNHVIPVVVEDFEKDQAQDDQPNPKKRRAMKRRFPNTEIQMAIE